VALPLVLLAALLVPAVAVGEGLTFTGSIESFRLQVRPGERVERAFRLNLSGENKQTRFRTHMRDWWNSDDGRQSFYAKPGTISRSCSEWVSWSPAEVTIEPGGALETRLSISIPTTAEPGGYWCVLTVDQLPSALAPEGETIRLNFLASISVGIFLYVEPVERRAQILSVDFVDQEMRLRVENKGNCPLGIEGWVEFFRPGESEPVAKAVIARRTALTEPVRNVILKTRVPAEDTLPAGTYLVRAILDIGLDHYIGIQRQMEIGR
jgi:hypothetical protein